MSETTTSPAPPTVSDLLQRIEDSWSAFLASVDDLEDDALQEPNAVGMWSLKELFGHVAFWDDLGRENAALALSGQVRVFDDFEALNQADHEARQGRTLSEERAAMHQAHAALVTNLEDRSELEAADIDEAIAGATYEHYDEHLADVRAWREQLGV